ncbi:hypothetical protein M885DRAFT_553006 [Pelagophyceae sp. CCMP2097]|nr:hypothetical protein M885DRAFT_553006 [Pelagophyceae sp. CCMP2097]
MRASERRESVQLRREQQAWSASEQQRAFAAKMTLELDGAAEWRVTAARLDALGLSPVELEAMSAPDRLAFILGAELDTAQRKLVAVEALLDDHISHSPAFLELSEEKYLLRKFFLGIRGCTLRLHAEAMRAALEKHEARQAAGGSGDAHHGHVRESAWMIAESTVFERWLLWTQVRRRRQFGRLRNINRIMEEETCPKIEDFGPPSPLPKAPTWTRPAAPAPAPAPAPASLRPEAAAAPRTVRVYSARTQWGLDGRPRPPRPPRKVSESKAFPLKVSESKAFPLLGTADAAGDEASLPTVRTASVDSLERCRLMDAARRLHYHLSTRVRQDNVLALRRPESRASRPTSRPATGLGRPRFRLLSASPLQHSRGLASAGSSGLAGSPGLGSALRIAAGDAPAKRPKTSSSTSPRLPHVSPLPQFLPQWEPVEPLGPPAAPVFNGGAWQGPGCREVLAGKF